MKEESWKRNPGEGIRKMERMRNIEEEAWMMYLGGHMHGPISHHIGTQQEARMQKVPARDPQRHQEAPRRPQGNIHDLHSLSTKVDHRSAATGPYTATGPLHQTVGTPIQSRAVWEYVCVRMRRHEGITRPYTFVK